MPLSSLLTAPLFALFTMLGGFQWQYGSQTDSSGNAWVELSADENLDGVKVKITGSDGSSLNKTLSLKPNKPAKITWKQKDRQVEYQIEIEANEAFTRETFAVQKPVAGGKQGSFELLSDRTDIVDHQKIRYKTPFTVSSRELQVYNTDGDLIVEKLVTDEVVEAGGSFEMTWNTTDEVFMIKVTGEDDTGYSYTDTRVPWSIDVPHTEVNFDSGKAIIKPEEEPKVSEVFAVIAHELAALDKASQAVNQKLAPQLYIVGYTDTVGNANDNQKLSEARAKAIAQYFYDKGVWCEIYYAGMGERGLAVETGDNVDEVRNRRALYVLGMQKPSGGGGIPAAGAWKKLADERTRMLNKLPDLPESYVKYKEEQRRKREAKFGRGGDSGSSSFGSNNDDGDDEWGKGNYDGGSGSDSDSSSGGGRGGRGGRGGPPSVGGEPGASKKGCAVEDQPLGSLGVIAGLFGLLGLRRRRRAS
jgi:outer membrane protein OmpA-like peptidoglycan-associated protein